MLRELGEDMPACLEGGHVVNAEVAAIAVLEFTVSEGSFVVYAEDIFDILMTEISAVAVNVEYLYFDWLRMVVDMPKNAASCSDHFDGILWLSTTGSLGDCEADTKWSEV